MKKSIIIAMVATFTFIANAQNAVIFSEFTTINVTATDIKDTKETIVIQNDKVDLIIKNHSVSGKLQGNYQVTPEQAVILGCDASEASTLEAHLKNCVAYEHIKKYADYEIVKELGKWSHHYLKKFGLKFDNTELKLAKI